MFWCILLFFLSHVQSQVVTIKSGIANAWMDDFKISSSDVDGENGWTNNLFTTASNEAEGVNNSTYHGDFTGSTERYSQATLNSFHRYFQCKATSRVQVAFNVRVCGTDTEDSIFFHIDGVELGTPMTLGCVNGTRVNNDIYEQTQDDNLEQPCTPTPGEFSLECNNRQELFRIAQYDFNEITENSFEANLPFQARFFLRYSYSDEHIWIYNIKIACIADTPNNDGTRSGSGGIIALEPTFWETQAGATEPGYSQNGFVVSLHGEVRYNPGSDCCILFRGDYPEDEIPDHCLNFCNQTMCAVETHTCYYTRFGNGDCCEASRDTKAVDIGMIDPSNCPCVLAETCGATALCGRGLIGYIQDENEIAFPPFLQIFPVANDVGVECVVEIDENGAITLKAWSLPVGYFNTGNDGGNYYYVATGADNPTRIASFFNSYPPDLVDKWTDAAEWQFVSLDGISFIAKNSAAFDEELEASETKIKPKRRNSDIVTSPNEYEVIVNILKSPYVVTLLVILVSLCGFCIGIGSYVANQCCKCKKNDNYSRVKDIDL